ncbi:MAG TPA: CBS domain-containing protein [Thermoanaerobaculia bacterium]
MQERSESTIVRVRDVMTARPASALASTSLPDIAKMLIEHDCGAIPIVADAKGRKPIGVVTDRDIACRAVAEGENSSRLTAGDCMSSPCLTAEEETSLEDCCRLMEVNRVRRIVVVDGSGGCTGIVSQADVARRAPEAKIAEVVRKVSQPTASASAVS